MKKRCSRNDCRTNWLMVISSSGVKLEITNKLTKSSVVTAKTVLTNIMSHIRTEYILYAFDIFFKDLC